MYVCVYVYAWKYVSTYVYILHVMKYVQYVMYMYTLCLYVSSRVSSWTYVCMWMQSDMTKVLPHLFNSAGASGQVIHTGLRYQHHVFQPNSAECTKPTQQH